MSKRQRHSCERRTCGVRAGAATCQRARTACDERTTFASRFASLACVVGKEGDAFRESERNRRMADAFAKTARTPATAA